MLLNEPEGTQVAKAGRFREPREWPAFLPPFSQFGASFAPDGQLWIQRTNTVGGHQSYDLINEVGQAVGRVDLEIGTKVLGFGREKVYVVRIDKDDLQFVQVFSMPTLERGPQHD